MLKTSSVKNWQDGTASLCRSPEPKREEPRGCSPTKEGPLPTRGGLNFPFDGVLRWMGIHHSPGPALVGSQTGDAFPPVSQDEGKLEVDQPARMTAWFCLPGLPGYPKTWLWVAQYRQCTQAPGRSKTNSLWRKLPSSSPSNYPYKRFFKYNDQHTVKDNLGHKEIRLQPTALEAQFLWLLDSKSDTWWQGWHRVYGHQQLCVQHPGTVWGGDSVGACVCLQSAGKLSPWQSWSGFLIIF